jgi:hypothetical protein
MARAAFRQPASLGRDTDLGPRPQAQYIEQHGRCSQQYRAAQLAQMGWGHSPIRR